MSKEELYSKLDEVMNNVRDMVNEYLISNNITNYDEMFSVSIDLKSNYSSYFLLLSDETVKQIKDEHNGTYGGQNIHVLDHYTPDFTDEEE